MTTLQARREAGLRPAVRLRQLRQQLGAQRRRQLRGVGVHLAQHLRHDAVAPVRAAPRAGAPARSAGCCGLGELLRREDCLLRFLGVFVEIHRVNLADATQDGRPALRARKVRRWRHLLRWRRTEVLCYSLFRTGRWRLCSRGEASVLRSYAAEFVLLASISAALRSAFAARGSVRAAAAPRLWHTDRRAGPACRPPACPAPFRRNTWPICVSRRDLQAKRLAAQRRHLRFPPEHSCRHGHGHPRIEIVPLALELRHGVRAGPQIEIAGRAAVQPRVHLPRRRARAIRPSPRPGCARRRSAYGRRA